MPDRTVQHRLGVLYSLGLVNRHRPRATVGTCPYHVWLTPFGAAAIGAQPPRSWSMDLAGLQTMAALCDLWLGLRDHGPGAGLVVTDWRRLRAGVTYADRRTGEERRLLADAQLTARVGTDAQIAALLVARVGLVGSHPAALATEAVWHSAADNADHRLVEVLAGLAEVGR